MKPQFAQQYADLERWHWWFRGRRKILARILRRELDGRRSPSIATVGCGPAVGLLWLKSLSGADGLVVGLDADERHAHDVPQDIHYVVGKLEEVPLADTSFDLVLALDVLEHLDDDVTGLRTAFRLVKPGGVLLVTVPALPSLWGRQDEVSHHRRRYTRKTLFRIFELAALPRPSVYYFNSLLLPPIAAIRWYRRLTGGAGQSHSDFEDNRPGVANQILSAIFGAESHIIQRVPLPLGVSLLALLRRLPVPSARTHSL